MTSLLRSLIVCAVLAGLALLGYQRVLSDRNEAALAELQALNDDLARELELREAMVERLGRSRRVARLEIVDQRPAVVERAGDDGVAETEMLFIELDDDGGELARQNFVIPGDVVFVDAWTVKFAQRDVAVGHPLHGHTLVLLRRIYSDRMAPINGFPIDTPGAVPPGYAASDMSRFEQRVWEHFWQIAVDSELAASMGVRVAQGEALYKQVKRGQRFDLVVDAAGGISLTPVPEQRTAEVPTSFDG